LHRFIDISFTSIFENEADFNILLINILIIGMPAHYFTLKSLSNELCNLLNGSIISTVFTQQKNELLIGLSKFGDAQSPESDITVCVSVAPRNNYMFHRMGISRAKTNSVELFADAIGSVICDIHVHPSDRSVFITLDSSKQFVIQLYNTVASNVFLVNNKMEIIEAFKDNRKFMDDILQIKPSGINSTDNLHHELVPLGKLSIAASLKKIFPVLDRKYINEILSRSSVDCNTVTDLLSENEVNRIFEETKTIFQSPNHPFPCLYEIPHGDKLISVAELHHLHESTKTIFSTMNDAVKKYIFTVSRETGLETEKEKYLDKLRTILQHTEQSIKNAETHLSVDTSRMEKIGNILLSNLHLIKKGMKNIILEDIYGDGNSIEIELDPALAPSRNAEKYFEKGKRAEIRRIESMRRVKELKIRIDSIKPIIENLEKIYSSEEIKDFQKKYYSELKSMNIAINKKEEEEKPPFRIFTVAGGFEVWVGKSSANNDLLTTKFCKPHDLWFHARGAGGSHTVLKIPRGTENIPRESIKQAASIAAYYSKMRKASNVPVAYCERKYVRKPKGVAEGTVYLEREEVIFVSPKLP
jgi:predicted ribosome quality control (RQC) complex YloA/Tae2 family protein